MSCCCSTLSCICAERVWTANVDSAGIASSFIYECVSYNEIVYEYHTWTNLRLVSALSEQRELHHAGSLFGHTIAGLTIIGVVTTLLSQNGRRYGLIPKRKSSLLVDLPGLCVVGDHLRELFLELRSVVF